MRPERVERHRLRRRRQSSRLHRDVASSRTSCRGGRAESGARRRSGCRRPSPRLRRRGSRRWPRVRGKRQSGLRRRGEAIVVRAHGSTNPPAGSRRMTPRTVFPSMLPPTHAKPGATGSMQGCHNPRAREARVPVHRGLGAAFGDAMDARAIVSRLTLRSSHVGVAGADYTRGSSRSKSRRRRQGSALRNRPASPRPFRALPVLASFATHCPDAGRVLAADEEKAPTSDGEEQSSRGIVLGMFTSSNT